MEITKLSHNIALLVFISSIYDCKLLLKERDANNLDWQVMQCTIISKIIKKVYHKYEQNCKCQKHFIQSHSIIIIIDANINVMSRNLKEINIKLNS